VRRTGQYACVSADSSEHESGLRKLMADSHGYEYDSSRTLAEAKAHDDSVVIIEGDDGGQIYAAFLASEVGCTEDALAQLLLDLDAIAWPGNYPDMAHVFYERHQVGATIPGGMGGGIVVEGGWVHPEFHELNLADQIREVVVGTRARIEESS
jgi:hypothetical protein